MRKGFTILELLVASLLLGMLTTILTMIINQSSIAWRTGTAMVADLDEVRDNMAELRDESDNAFMCKGKVRRVVGLWQSNGDLNERACNADNVENADNGRWKTPILTPKVSNQNTVWSEGQNMIPVGQGDQGDSGKTYTVNVMSAGPDKEFKTWDDVWSYPDDFE